MIDKVFLFAALRRRDLDAMAGALAQRLLQNLAVLDLVRQQHEPRRRLVGIELRQEGIEHFARTEALVGARKIGAIAPVLIGAEEEDFDAELSGLLGNGEDIGLLDGMRIDPLHALDVGERGDAVAQPRRALIVEHLGGLVHLVCQQIAHRAALAGKEGAGFVHQRRVICRIDLAGAGRGAALDLIKHGRVRLA